MATKTKAAPAKKSAARISKALSAPAKEQPAAKAAPAIKLPKTPAACVDLLYVTQQKRFALNKEVEKLESMESAIREHLISTLPKSDATGVAGKVARAHIEKKRVVKIADWNKYYAYILAQAKKVGATAAFTLLQKRPGDTAIKERWEKGVKVPGAEPFDVPFVSLHKV